jgi:hypothetical protein
MLHPQKGLHYHDVFHSQITKLVTNFSVYWSAEGYGALFHCSAKIRNLAKLAEVCVD